MSHYQPTLHRKSSAPWDRLRPVKQDPLDSVGFVSKGDNRLLDSKAQELYYQKITARYMQYCTSNAKSVNPSFIPLATDSCSTTEYGLALREQTSHSSSLRPITPSDNSTGKQLGSSKWAAPQTPRLAADPAEELSIILTALRKLREGILASSSSATSVLFSQRVHVFNIRLAILALHPESYHASLRYLFTSLHTCDHPLPKTEVREMLSYLILDTALRLRDMNEAYRLYLQAKTNYSFLNRDVELILQAVVTHNWPLFWRLRGRVDGYTRAIMHWKLDSLRVSVLKAIGKSYLRCDVDWILKSTTNGEFDWDNLVVKENVGWVREGKMAVIRKPKPKTQSIASATPATG